MNPTTTEAMLPDDALDAFARAVESIVARVYPDALPAPVTFEAPRRPEFGDFATNIAFTLAKAARRSPNDVANVLIEKLRSESPGVSARFSSIDAVAGFINVRLAPAVWQTSIARIVRDGANFGRALPSGERISLEFGSANPTGPLVVVQGRTLSIGDTLVRAFRYCGYDVFVEWIINDAGSQMETLGRSLFARYMQHYDPTCAFPDDGYPGEYLVPIAEAIVERDGEKWRNLPQPPIAQFAQIGRDAILAEQRATAERFGVHYDLWQSEKELRASGRMDEDLDKLRAMGLIYEADGAQYFRTSEFGDDKDRVIIRSDGSPTYFAPDIAYHFEKLSRADRAIDILGPDHHGYIGRLKAAAAAMGFPGKLDILIAQQITLMRGGEQVSMSKREGNIITLDEILDEVGVDAARFFFTMLATDSPLTFDLNLAVEQTSDNPGVLRAVRARADRLGIASRRSGRRRGYAPFTSARRIDARCGNSSSATPRRAAACCPRRHRQSRAAPAHQIRAGCRDRVPSILHRVHDLGRRARAAPGASRTVRCDEIRACRSARTNGRQRT